MQPFEYLEPESLSQAVGLLAERPGAARIVAGGTDLLSEIKEGVVKPYQLISLARIPDLAGVVPTEDGLTIGAMTTIHDIASHPVIRANYTALAQAAAGLATPQIRNVGTLGGNLNQRPRCWYYRNPLTRCLKKGGDHCYALAGHNKYLCVTGGDRCYIVHPSDTAVALTVLGASVAVAGPSGVRRWPISEFFVTPAQNLIHENVLAPGELVTGVHLPPAAAGQRSLYLKARERESGDFALVSVAVFLAVADNTVTQATVALGGVAPVPYRARQVEEYLTGRAVPAVDLAYAGSLALPDARPMADNRYKVTMATNLVRRAVDQCLQLTADQWRLIANTEP